jgi:hypothetical protein
MMPPTNLSFITSTNLSNIRNTIISTPGIWKPVFGGSNQRFHTPNLKDFPNLYTTVTQHMSWYVALVQKQYPSLIYVNYSILLSKADAPDQEFHFDYQDSVINKDPLRQPISLIVALDPFVLNIVTERQDNNVTFVARGVQEGSCIYFTNKVEHGGAKNLYRQNGQSVDAMRLFAYMVSDEKDFPLDAVQYFTNNNATL